jgi:hypothetical protein
MTAFPCTTNSWYDLAEYKEVPKSGELRKLPPQKDIEESEESEGDKPKTSKAV